MSYEFNQLGSGLILSCRLSSSLVHMNNILLGPERSLQQVYLMAELTGQVQMHWYISNLYLHHIHQHPTGQSKAHGQAQYHGIGWCLRGLSREGETNDNYLLNKNLIYYSAGVAQ